jgi:hypothetical protein
MMHIIDLIDRTQQVFASIDNYSKNVAAQKFFVPQKPGKWSIAQHIQHLSVSTSSASLAYRLPKFMVGIIGGKANRPSRSYDELVSKYKAKLETGGRASGKYVPKEMEAELGKENVIKDWQTATVKYLYYLKKQHNEDDLDKYVAPHPLLGKITLRELAYFTIYHTLHHLQIMQDRLEE